MDNLELLVGKLPQKRGNRSQRLYIAITLLLLFVATISSSTYQTFLKNFVLHGCSVFVICVLIEFVSRFVLGYEELNHLSTRYENSYALLLKELFHFSQMNTFLFSISFSMCVILYFLTEEWNLGLCRIVCIALATHFLQKASPMSNGPVYESLRVQNSNGLDYGSGMAHSFFHGYLKLVIPKTGNLDKHLRELMVDYEDSNGVKFARYKLFILIPTSLECPPSLQDEINSPTILESSSLEEKKITVAGVQNRIYKNSVYKIKDGNGRKYVSAEYATPLKTFKDVVSCYGKHSVYYKRHKDDIVLQFYLTLKQILRENKNCGDYCELIYFDDKDEDGNTKDVGDVILERIQAI